MQTILIVNPKGGSGKSTLSTNLAGYFACWGVNVAIADFDPQSSTLDWLAARPAISPKIQGIDAHKGALPHAIKCDYLILDSPSNHYGDDLLPLVQRADRIIVPVLPSPHDIRAVRRFIYRMATDDRFSPKMGALGLVANRVRQNTRSFKLLQEFLEATPLPCIGALRDTQNYVAAAESGLSIFDMPPKIVEKELQQWQRLIQWLCPTPVFAPRPAMAETKKQGDPFDVSFMMLQTADRSFFS